MTLIGVSAQFVFEHTVSKSNGKTYANIVSVLRMKNQKPFPVPADFVAFKDKDDTDAAEVEPKLQVTRI